MYLIYGKNKYAHIVKMHNFVHLVVVVAMIPFAFNSIEFDEHKLVNWKEIKY